MMVVWDCGRIVNRRRRRLVLAPAPSRIGRTTESVLLMSQVCEFRWRSMVDAAAAAQSDSPIWYT
jgi:hypothetical protein